MLKKKETLRNKDKRHKEEGEKEGKASKQNSILNNQSKFVFLKKLLEQKSKKLTKDLIKT
jgi:hypothetical protein